MSSWLTKAIENLDTHPHKGWVATALFSTLTYVGQIIVKAPPQVFQWIGYLTILFTCAGAGLHMMIQYVRWRRLRKGLDSEPPFGTK